MCFLFAFLYNISKWILLVENQKTYRESWKYKNTNYMEVPFFHTRSQKSKDAESQALSGLLGMRSLFWPSRSPDTLFPRWASFCSSLQWHFHKPSTCSVRLVCGWMHTDRSYSFCCCFTRTVMKNSVRYALEVKKSFLFFQMIPIWNI